MLSQGLLDRGDQIEAIKYFTADVSPRAGDPEAPMRQANYFRALKTIPELSIHKGKFLTRSKLRPLTDDPETYVKVQDTEEKGSDVNLAANLLMDAFCDSYDVALVLSQDTDLLEAIRMVTQDLGKLVVVAWLDGTQPGKLHRAFASHIRFVSNGLIEQSQFPEVVRGQNGAKIHRPKDWDPDREM